MEGFPGPLQVLHVLGVVGGNDSRNTNHVDKVLSFIPFSFSPSFSFWFQRFKLKALHMLCKYSTTEIESLSMFHLF